MIKAAILLAIAAAMLVAAVPAVAVDDTFVITYWLGPEASDMRIAEVAEANFTVAGPPAGPVSVEDNLKYLDFCRKYGIKGLVHDARVKAKLPSDPGFEANLDAVIADYSKHPALYGYMILDEPGPNMFPLLAAVNQYLLKKDPAHVPYINIFPNYVDQPVIGVPYTQHVEDYVSQVKPAILAYDHYALFAGYERDTYFENLEIVRDAAIKHGIPWMSTILSTPHYNYRDPNIADIRWQVYTNLAYGGHGIGYYTYWTPGEVELGYRNAIIGPDGKRTPHYYMVKRVNGEMKAWAPTLMKLTSTGVYHTGKLPIGTKALPALPIIKSVSGSDLVIGLFDGPGKSKWMMLVNRDPRKAASATVEFSTPVRVSELSKRTGKLEPLRASNNYEATPVGLELQPGDGRLFELDAKK